MSSARLAAIQVPGAGQLRFAQTDLPDLAAGDWVAFIWSWGLEAGIVVFLGDLPPEPGNLPAVTHQLTASERARVIEQVELARGLIPRAVDLSEQRFPDLRVGGLRFTLNGDRAILTGQISQSTDQSALSCAMQELLGTVVCLEPDGPEGHRFGGAGRLTPDPDKTSLDALLRSRLPLEKLHQNPAPAGLPRIGASVSVGSEHGRIVSISTRRREATIELADGSERLMPLATLGERVDH